MNGNDQARYFNCIARQQNGGFYGPGLLGQGSGLAGLGWLSQPSMETATISLEKQIERDFYAYLKDWDKGE
jgi:hypothetical protein